MSTLQQPLRRHLEARKSWLVGLQGGWQALLILGTAQPSPFASTVVNRQTWRKKETTSDESPDPTDAASGWSF